GSCRRAGDLAARYGGEEFMLLLPATDLGAAADLAEAVRREVKALAIEHLGGGMSGLLTLSAGVSATVPPTDDGSRALVAAADAALYAAKGAGRNRVVAVPFPGH
ncbi:MAG TPA: diguanylate cyclase, partial [Thermoanaerobaculia bacterium]|nr:diguanylate cyclase [Thermoanaerobaculia bacterium]